MRLRPQHLTIAPLRVRMTHRPFHLVGWKEELRRGLAPHYLVSRLRILLSPYRCPVESATSAARRAGRCKAEPDLGR